MKIFSTWPLLLLALAAPAAMAADYTSQAGSRLQFTASYQDESFTGRFEKFTARINFDPVHPEAARFDVRIPLATARTDNDERDEALQGTDFFDARARPEARYEATKVVRLKDGRFRADGTLTLRGVKKAVPLLFRFTPGAPATLVGEATVNRLDFGVGTGDFADLEMIPNAVKVTTRLVLKPSAAPTPPAATQGKTDPRR
jgi:polyisoprenoid-binding protein YceI